MNYLKVYTSLISKAQRITKGGYTEKHHILPRCLGGLDTKENVISLTAREHFLAHRLLAKIHNIDKLWFAIWSMCRKNDNQKHRYIPNSRVYQVVKENMSKRMKGKSNKKNSDILKEKYKNKDSQTIANNPFFKKGKDHPGYGKAYCKGKTPWNKGKSFEETYGKERAEQLKKDHSNKIRGHVTSEETKKKMRLAKIGKSKEVVICPYCKKNGGKPAMYRFHFNQCKEKT